MPLDPICGMTVEASSPIRAECDGETFYFCSEGCRGKFLAQSAGEEGESSVCCKGHHPPQPPPPADVVAYGGYICPMCPGVRQDHPGDCPVCGMPLEPERVAADQPPDNAELNDMTVRFWLGAVMTVPVMLLAMQPMGGMDRTTAGLAQFILSTPVVFWAGWPLLKRAGRSLASRNWNMFTLIGMGVLAAYGFSVVNLLFSDLFPPALRGLFYFESAAMITVLVLLGQMLELRARSRTGDAIRQLMSLAPDTARHIDEAGNEADIPVAEVRSGDMLRVRPGERVPVDGVITKGATYIDESMLTGEAEPVRKTEGTEVAAGTVNGSGSFLMRAEQVGGQTVLARIVEMVARAQRSRAPIQRLADRVAAVFVPAVVAVALVAFAGWMMAGPEPRLAYALVSAISVLVIACPCALGLATPMSVMVGVGQGAHSGVLIKDAAVFETLERIDTVAVDKTGTLTEGKPEVTAIFAADGVTEKTLLTVAASLEQPSEHPLGAAILRAAQGRGVIFTPVTDFHAEAGAGVRGRCDGAEVLAGSAAFLRQSGIQIESLEEEVMAAADGQTTVFVARAAQPLGALAIADPIKATAPEAVKALHALGLRVVMLTGDNPATASRIATQLGLNDFAAGLLPGGKQERVKLLQKEGCLVAMAGDGINDAPALAQSDVGIAMSTGTDVAIDSAGITLLHGDLRGIVRALILSRAVMRNIRQNLFFAFIYNLLGIPLAAGVLYPIFGLLLSPMVAAAAMSLSSLSVIANALRLRKVSLK